MPKLIVYLIRVLTICYVSMWMLGCSAKQPISGHVPSVSFKTYSNETFSLSPADTDVTLLVFWATWCQPCLMEVPSLVRLHEKYKGRHFRVLSVNVDDKEGQKVKAISREFGITYPVLIGTDEILMQFGGIAALPTTFLIGKDGRLLEKLQGVQPEEILEHKVLTALGV